MDDLGSELFRRRNEDMNRAIGPEFYLSFPQGEKGVVFASADKKPGLETGSPLPNDNLPREGPLSAENFNAEALGAGVTSVLSTAESLLMGHGLFLISRPRITPES